MTAAEDTSAQPLSPVIPPPEAILAHLAVVTTEAAALASN